MKKTAVYAMSLLVAAFCSSCGDQKNSTEVASTPATSTSEAVASAPQQVNIRYVDGDSIMSQYNLAKDVQEVMLKAHSRLDNLEQSRGTEIQRLANQIEEKMRNNGYLTEDSYKADMAKLQRMQQDAQNALASMQRSASQEVEQQQRILNDSIEAFIKDYNRKMGYDAILFKSSGLYFNPDLDITKEVVEGLNARYNKVSK